MSGRVSAARDPVGEVTCWVLGCRRRVYTRPVPVHLTADVAILAVLCEVHDRQLRLAAGQSVHEAFPPPADDEGRWPRLYRGDAA